MINTLNIKQAQLQNGFLTVGSGKEVILIMGSCRVCPYVNYFDRWNKSNGNRFTIHSIDPFNFNWNVNDERVDYERSLAMWETDERMLNMLQSVNVFIHEFYRNAGMFNVNKNGINNIYQYGLNPEMDICICNFNDYFILVNDIVNFDAEMRKKAVQDVNVIGRLSDQTKKAIFKVSKTNIDKFLYVCSKSDIPEMGLHFLNNFQKVRFFHSYNHITKYFTLAIFEYINDKFLHLNLSKEFMDEIAKEDIFANSFTKLTSYDVEHYGFEWGEEIVPLSL